MGGGSSKDVTRPGALMEEAVTDLTRCGSAPDLYPVALSLRRRGEERGEAVEEKHVERFAGHEGLRLQARFARNCILFSALSAEAYVNAFLDGRVTGSDFDAIDRLPTVEKYVIGVTYAVDERVFDRGAEPIQTLKLLFGARDALVHPKPGNRKAVTPGAAGQFLVAAATAAQTLIERAGAGEIICKDISDFPTIFIQWGKDWTGALPYLNTEAPPNLAAQAAERRRFGR
jgi:hypothetical protein